MPLGTHDIKPASSQGLLLKVGDFLANRSFCGIPLRAFCHIGQLVANTHRNVTTKLNIRTATRHIGGNRYRTRHTGLGHNIGFLLMEACIQNRKGFRRLA